MLLLSFHKTVLFSWTEQFYCNLLLSTILSLGTIFTDCVGSIDGVTRAGYSDNIDILRKQYSGCTIVFGNVVIAHLQQKAIGNQTMEEMEKKLDFLNHIEQVIRQIYKSKFFSRKILSLKKTLFSFLLLIVSSFFL